MKNLQNNSVVAINCSIEDSEIAVGFIVASPSATKGQVLVDQDSGIRYNIALPDELVDQQFPSALGAVSLQLLLS